MFINDCVPEKIDTVKLGEVISGYLCQNGVPVLSFERNSRKSIFAKTDRLIRALIESSFLIKTMLIIEGKEWLLNEKKE